MRPFPLNCYLSRSVFIFQAGGTSVFTIRISAAFILSAAMTATPLLASTTASTTTHRSTTTHKTTTHRSTTTNRTTSTHRNTAVAHAGSSHRTSRSRKHRPRGQQAIDAERVTEIQQALIREHYMNGEANGEWDAATISAMQKFQADHGWQTKLTPDSRALKNARTGSRLLQSHQRQGLIVRRAASGEHHSCRTVRWICRRGGHQPLTGQ